MESFKQYVTNNQQGAGIALLPGGFKPPTKGHYNALKYMLTNSRSAIVFIGKTERDGITAEQSKAIWEVYAKTLGKPVEVRVADVTPVRSVYEYADENLNTKLSVGAGSKDEDIKRYDYFDKNKEKYPLVEVKKIPIQSGGISGTLTRRLIKEDLDEALKYFVPEEVSTEGREMIKLILQGS